MDISEADLTSPETTTKSVVTSVSTATLATGSFERLRLSTTAKQATTGSDSLGSFRLFDFSQNNKLTTYISSAVIFNILILGGL